MRTCGFQLSVGSSCLSVSPAVSEHFVLMDDPNSEGATAECSAYLRNPTVGHFKSFCGSLILIPAIFYWAVWGDIR